MTWWSVRESHTPDNEYDVVKWLDEAPARSDAQYHREEHGLDATHVEADGRPDPEEVLK